jgi:Fic family protein
VIPSQISSGVVPGNPLGLGSHFASNPTVSRNYNNIDPAAAEPQRGRQRFALAPFVLGYLEHLAKADIRIDTGASLSGNAATFAHSAAVSDENTKVLAQSVMASSHIEQEGVYGKEVELVFAAVTQPEDGVPRNHELSERAQAIVDITRAAKWMIETGAQYKAWITYDFVLELHRRMFQSTRPEIAGKLKYQEVEISGAAYKVSTLPMQKTESFLRSLCERLNSRFLLAESQSAENMVLLSAEFVLDFLAIHPFVDGNGRTARLLSTYLLDRAGYHFVRFYPLDEVMLESQKEYFQALFQAQLGWYGKDEDLTPWVNYYVQAIHTQYQRAFEKVRKQGHTIQH